MKCYSKILYKQKIKIKFSQKKSYLIQLDSKQSLKNSINKCTITIVDEYQNKGVKADVKGSLISTDFLNANLSLLKNKI